MTSNVGHQVAEGFKQWDQADEVECKPVLSRHTQLELVDCLVSNIHAITKRRDAVRRTKLQPTFGRDDQNFAN